MFYWGCNKKNCQQHRVLCNWGLTEVQSSAVHIQTSYPADGILTSRNAKHQILIINLASVPGGQLANTPTATKPRAFPASPLHFIFCGQTNKFWTVDFFSTFLVHKFLLQFIVLARAWQMVLYKNFISLLSQNIFVAQSFGLCRQHRVWRKAGRTLSCTGGGNFVGLWFGAGRASLIFLLLPFTFLSLIGCGSRAGR